MFKAFTVTALCASLAIQTASAEEVVLAKGAGARTCGEFAEAYRKNPALAEQAYFTWAQGFLTRKIHGGRRM